MAWGGGFKCELKGQAPIIHSCGPASYKTYCRPSPGWPAGNLGSTSAPGRETHCTP